MKAELLDRILDGIPGARKDGAAHLFPEESNVSVFVGTPSEVLTVAKVTRIERNGDLTAVDSHSGDRLHLPTDAVLMVKVGVADKRAGKGGAGFR